MIADSLSLDIDRINRSEVSDWRGHGPEFVSKLYYILDGEAWLSHSGRRFQLKPGYVYLIPGQRLGSYGADAPFSLYWIHFRAELRHHINFFDHFDLHDYRHEAEFPALQPDFEALNQAVRANNMTSAIRAQSLLMGILAHFIKPRNSYRQRQRESALQRLEPVLEMIHKDLHAAPSLKEMAAAVHLEPSYFSRYFKSVMGLSPKIYIQRQRFDEAAAMLLHTDQSIEAIGDELGYYDAFHFSKSFKKWTGLSPSAYRKKPQLQP